MLGELAGDCPERPSGRLTEDQGGIPISCLAFVGLRFEAFPEDIASFERPAFSISYLVFERGQRCTFDWFHLVWGRNFKVNDELVTGVFGRVQLVAFGISFDYLNFQWQCIPAALLALSTLESLPSMNLVLRPRINGLFIIINSFSSYDSSGTVFLLRELLARSVHPFPMNGLDLLTLAAEDKKQSFQKATRPRQVK